LPILIKADIVLSIIYNPNAMNRSPAISVERCFNVKFDSMLKGTMIRTVTGRMNENICFNRVFIFLFTVNFDLQTTA
jgi:hypothetical protein